MRGIIRITVLSVLLFALPNVAAEDPTLSIPDPAELVDSAEGAVSEQRDTTTALTRAAYYAGSQSANDVQMLSFPEGRLTTFAGATGDFGEATVLTVRDLAFANYDWTSESAYAKVDEVTAVLAAGDTIGESGVDAVRVLTEATLSVLCSQPVDPTACQDGSLGAAVQDEVEDLLERTSKEASEERFTATQAAAERLVKAIVPLP